MKTNILFFGFFTVSLLLGSCAATNNLTMSVTEPADIHLASDVTRIGIINRSVPSEGNKTVDQIDKILSLEGLNLDREGAAAAVTGLSDELSRDNRFEAIEIIEEGEAQKKGLGVFPAALPWATVEQICEENNVDVLFSLEFYDTDTKADLQLTTVTIPNDFGIKAKVPGHRITLNTVIKNGWRVYDPLNKRLLDQVVKNDFVTSRGEGINPVRAVEAIIGRKEAVKHVSSAIGNSYGLKIKPLRRRVTREYFVRGTDNFVIARRRAQAGNWQTAADLWEQDLNHPKAKIAGRAFYNMAIINEINGNLNEAINYASKSYSDYGTRNALRYVNILRNRIVEKQVLENQISKLDFTNE
ncbi:MAG: DUF6340 family protein [Maribacter sp.]